MFYNDLGMWIYFSPVNLMKSNNRSNVSLENSATKLRYVIGVNTHCVLKERMQKSLSIFLKLIIH
jgi:hypothetical protein